MAAMFQAQSANWEETQEKMSQFVFPADAGSLSCSIPDHLMNSRLLPPLPLELRASTLNPGQGRTTPGVGNHSVTNQRNPCHLATYAIDADKKVRLSCPTLQ